MPTMRNEVHVCDYDNGHAMSTDCWCEPIEVNSAVNKHGIAVLVVRHHDDVPWARGMVVALRNAHFSAPSPDFRANDAWITRALTPPWDTRLLPPHDPNERSI